MVMEPSVVPISATVRADPPPKATLFSAIRPRSAFYANNVVFRQYIIQIVISGAVLHLKLALAVR